MEDIDKNGDGLIDLDEYIGEFLQGRKQGEQVFGNLFYMITSHCSLLMLQVTCTTRTETPPNLSG